MYYNDYNRPMEEPQVPAPIPQETPKKKRTGLKVAALCLACALVGGLGGVGAANLWGSNAAANNTTIYESGRTPTVVNVAQVDGHTALSVADVYATNLESVVGVNGNVKTNYWGQTVSNAVAGSGFVITSDGYILTNYHVIDGVSDLKVTFADGSAYDATLVGGEEANDIAVLKIEAAGLRPVVVGNSSALKVGEQVVAIGNPLGELTFTLTAGYVSALDRLITMSDGTAINVMQTDAAINSGNSGGPLFNIYGECIGITNAKYSNNGSSEAAIEGIGFAIPINDVIDMVTDIMEKGYVTGKPSVGILMEEVSDEAIYRYRIPDGAYIAAVLEGSCADKGGIQVGDIITAVGDDAITTREELQNAVRKSRAGDTVTFTVYRDGETLKVTLTLDEYDLDRQTAMDELYTQYQTEYYQTQQQQQQQQQQQSGSNWPFGSWPFGGWNW